MPIADDVYSHPKTSDIWSQPDPLQNTDAWGSRARRPHAGRTGQRAKRAIPSGGQDLASALLRIGIELRTYSAEQVKQQEYVKELTAARRKAEQKVQALDAMQERVAAGLVALRNANNRIMELASLNVNWDSYGAYPITAKAVATSTAILLELQEHILVERHAISMMTFIAPLADGGLQLEWECESDQLELEILGDGSIGYVHLRNGVVESSREGDADPLTLTDAITLIETICGFEEEKAAAR